MRYLALFRGINVGGKNTVKMKELKELFSELGFTDVSSYIQSGNILFTTDKNISEFSKEVADAFTHRFGFSVPIMYRTKAEMLILRDRLPFTAEEIAEAERQDPKMVHLYVYFSTASMSQQEVSGIGERAVVKDRDIYYLTEQSIRLSKLTTKLNKLSDGLTARNWKTVLRLTALLEE
ncbi:DUF1697 domain-containing protein [Enterococcus xiangfangensis]|uniref:DUF1697 domain-containing protein n=1 Tax=Enterococcus xiangfangensis TaxID=1296537 RepID=A0ABU3F6H3_9ENTE|nr:DUF1697 domain-containing protein [Enterococcus xiangfangensis]MBM7710474.1 uncharacterized protein (DUF1697 family) [Enterococcus xiangfangensis]MDT2758262.1 DUF1697 domain-containing protein [Enterococcus xiangfangensis]